MPGWFVSYTASKQILGKWKIKILAKTTIILKYFVQVCVALPNCAFCLPVKK